MDGRDGQIDGDPGTRPAAPIEMSRHENARAASMFWVALAFLAILAVLLPHGGSDKKVEMPLYHAALAVSLLVCWVIVLAEGLAGYFAAPDRPRPALLRLLLIAVLPPFRMAIAAHRPNRHVWVPLRGWLEVGSATVADLERRTAIAMLITTAMIVPVLIVDFGFAKAVEAMPLLRLALVVMMAVIWFSFALEFIVMVSLAPKKIAYCKKHWINIVIIILPLVAFLRTLQFFRFLRLAKAGKMAKAYRLRGLVARGLKIALALNLIERFLSMNPEKYAAQLEDKIAEKEEELAELRQRLARTHEQIAERAAEDGGAEETG